MKKFTEILGQITNEKSDIRTLKCLLRLNQQNLNKGNLENYQKKLWKDFEDDYNGTIVIVRSNFDKEFAYFMPDRLEEQGFKETDLQLAFYWIDKTQLITCKSKEQHSFFQSGGQFNTFIGMEGWAVENDRSIRDSVRLNSNYWSGCEYGHDGYPKTGGENGSEIYFIAGTEEESDFKAQNIEIYAVNF